MKSIKGLLSHWQDSTRADSGRQDLSTEDSKLQAPSIKSQTNNKVKTTKYPKRLDQGYVVWNFGHWFCRLFGAWCLELSAFGSGVPNSLGNQFRVVLNFVYVLAQFQAALVRRRPGVRMRAMRAVLRRPGGGLRLDQPGGTRDVARSSWAWSWRSSGGGTFSASDGGRPSLSTSRPTIAFSCARRCRRRGNAQKVARSTRPGRRSAARGRSGRSIFPAPRPGPARPIAARESIGARCMTLPKSNPSDGPPNPEAADVGQSLREIVLACQACPELMARIAQILDDADRQVRGTGAVCLGGGCCCKFDLAPHRLYVSTAELAYLCLAPPPNPEACKKKRCPYQKNSRCTARNRRPLGCRTYFCRGTTGADLETFYERSHSLVRQLHQAFPLAAYRYIELTASIASFYGIDACAAAQR